MRQLALYIGLLSLLMSCGKKAQDSNSDTTKKADPIITEVDILLDQQELLCETDQSCPSYVTKVAIKVDQMLAEADTAQAPSKLRFCTGFLVDERTVATTASCLPELLRMRGQDCGRDVFFFFPQTLSKSTEKVQCKKVGVVSPIYGRENPALRRSDVVYLELSRPLPHRKTLPVSNEGMAHFQQLTMWGIDQVDEKTAFVRKQVCRAIHESYVNPLASKNTSPNMLLAECDFRNDHSGAPLVDAAGKVRGLAIQAIEKGLILYMESENLLLRPLKKMLYASNFSCAPLLGEEFFDNDNPECSKPLTEMILSQLREAMIHAPQVFEDKKREIEDKVNEANRFLNFAVVGEAYDFKLRPKCFKKISSFLGSLNTLKKAYVFSMDLPNLTRLKVGLNEYAKIEVIDTYAGVINYSFQFSPKDLKKRSSSTVFMWGRNLDLTFPNMSDHCE